MKLGNKKSKKRNLKGIECLNCGAPLHGNENFCPECGQKNDIRKPNFSIYFSNFFDNFFSFDSKIFNTLKILIFKPGILTKEYVAGKRVRYVNPFKLLLNLSIVYFVLQNLLNPFIDNDQIIKQKIKEDEMGIVTDTLPKKKKKKRRRVHEEVDYAKLLDSLFKADQLQEKLIDSQLSDKEKDSIYDRVLYAIGTQFHKSKNVDVDQGVVHVSFKSRKKKNKTKKSISLGNKLVSLYRLKDFIADKNIPYPKQMEDTIVNKISSASTFSKFGYYSSIIDYDDFDSLEPKELLGMLNLPINKIDTFIIKGLQNTKQLSKDSKNVKQFGNKILSKITISLFFILPIFALFFTVFYSGKYTTYTNNLILIFNIQSAFFVMLLIILLIDLFVNIFVSLGIGLWLIPLAKWLTILLFVLYFFYIYKSLRNCFKQGRFVTVTKIFFLNLIFTILAIFGFLIITFISLFF